MSVFRASVATAAMLFSTGPGWSQPFEPGSDEAAVWALEKQIYEQRAQGDTLFYSDISSEQYLGWPAPAETPMPYQSIRSFAQQGEFKPGEVIDVVSNGITIDGDTAISFYTTHRTVSPRGQPVDERYENIHVYVKRDGKWRLVGAMSRRLLPDELRAAPLAEPAED